MSAIETAKRLGIDLTLIEESLRLTPEQRPCSISMRSTWRCSCRRPGWRGREVVRKPPWVIFMWHKRLIVRRSKVLT